MRGEKSAPAGFAKMEEKMIRVNQENIKIEGDIMLLMSEFTILTKVLKDALTEKVCHGFAEDEINYAVKLAFSLDDDTEDAADRSHNLVDELVRQIVGEIFSEDGGNK